MYDIGNLATTVGALSRRGMQDEMKRKMLEKQIDDLGRNNPGVLNQALQMYQGSRRGAPPFSLDREMPTTKVITGGASVAVPNVAGGSVQGSMMPGGGGGGGGMTGTHSSGSPVGGSGWIDRNQERIGQLAVGTAENAYAGSNLAREDAVGASAQRDIEQRNAYEEGASIVREFAAGVPEGQRDRYEYGKALMLYKDPVKARAAANAMKDTLGDRDRMTQPEATVLAALVKDGKGKGGATDPAKQKAQLQDSIDVLERMLSGATDRGEMQSMGVIAAQIEKKKAELAALGTAAPATGEEDTSLPETYQIGPNSWTNDPKKIQEKILREKMTPGLPSQVVPSHGQAVAPATAPAAAVESPPTPEKLAATKALIDAQIAANRPGAVQPSGPGIVPTIAGAVVTSPRAAINALGTAKQFYSGKTSEGLKKVEANQAASREEDKKKGKGKGKTTAPKS